MNVYMMLIISSYKIFLSIKELELEIKNNKTHLLGSNFLK